MRFSRAELKCSVKGYTGAIFQSCSSLTDANIRFQLFSQQVAQMFTSLDPFSSVANLVPPPVGGNDLQEIPAVQATTPTQIASHNLPPAPQVAVSPKSAIKCNDPGPSLVLPAHRLKNPQPGDRWYIMYKGILLGVYYGS